ncbi:hypothetical protein AAC387_Pa02g3467 [Persea americana]
MMSSVPFPSSSSSSFLLEAPELSRSRASSTICNNSSQRSSAYIPKLEPFSRSKIERGVKGPSFIQKTENELADYCSTLEGDESYKCWRAYFELKDLERESSKEDVEKLLIQSGGVKTLMGCLNGIAAMRKLRNRELEANEQLNAKDQNQSHFPIPDGLPKTQEELEEEEEARMPDSPFTRLLRSKGKSPAWYSLPPDHETD